jgi:hypothetical protein
MIAGTDRPTASERQGTPDCLVEIGLAWLARPLGGQTPAERQAAIEEICGVIAQMRHRDPRLMDCERSRWVQRVTVRLCQQCGGMRGFDAAVQLELERRVLAALLTYHDWRERIAPVVVRSTATGPSEGGEISV